MGLLMVKLFWWFSETSSLFIWIIFFISNHNIYPKKFVGHFTVNYNDILWEVNTEISRYIVGLVTLNIFSLLSGPTRNLYGHFVVYRTSIILDSFEQLSMNYLDILSLLYVYVYIYIYIYIYINSIFYQPTHDELPRYSVRRFNVNILIVMLLFVPPPVISIFFFGSRTTN